MSLKFFSTIKGAALLLISLTLLSKGIGFIREILFAKFFGASREFEIYLIGAVLPITINTVVYYIAQNYFIPRYNKVKADKGSGSLFTSAVFWLFTLVFLSLAVVFYFSSDLIISLYTGTSDYTINNPAVIIFRLLLISIPLNAGFSVLAAYLNAEYRYSYPAIAQVLAGVAQIVIIFSLYDKLGIYVIPAGILSGFLLQIGYLWFYSKVNIDFVFRKENLAFLRNTASGSLLLIIILIEILNQLYVIFDRFYYSQVEEGGIAALNYAATLFQLPLSILSFGIATVLFPKISEAFSRKNYQQLKLYYNKSLLFNIAIYIPVVIILFYFGDFIVRIVFERGKFTDINTVQTFGVLRIFTVSLLFYSSYTLINKMIFSMNLVKQLLVISAVSVGIKIFLNALLVGEYEQDGLAVSTSASYIFISIAGFLVVHRKLNQMKDILSKPESA